MRKIIITMIFLLTLVGANGIVAQTANADDASRSPWRTQRPTEYRGLLPIGGFFTGSTNGRLTWRAARNRDPTSLSGGTARFR